MTFDLFKILTESTEYKKISSSIRGRVTPCSVFGLPESAKPHMAAAIAQEYPVLYLTSSEQRAERIAQDLSGYLKEQIEVFPPRLNVLFKETGSGHINDARVRVLNNACSGGRVVVATVDAAMYPLAPAQQYRDCSRTIEVGKTEDIGVLAEFAVTAGYTNSERVEARGQFSVRGGIFDIFSPHADFPSRIEFFGDEVDSIRSFSPDSQRSINKQDSLTICPANEIIMEEPLRKALATVLKNRVKQAKKTVKLSDYFSEIIEKIETGGQVNYNALVPFIYERPEFIWDYLPENTVIIVDEPNRVAERAENVRLEFEELYKALITDEKLLSAQAECMYEYPQLIGSMSKRQIITFQMLTAASHDFPPQVLCTVTAKGMQIFGGREEDFVAEVRNYLDTGYTLALVVNGQRRREILAEKLLNAGVEQNARLHIVPGEISQGFDYPLLKYAVISEGDIFGTHTSKVKKKASNRKMDTFIELEKGDYVVHEAHGIGVYDGVVKIETDGVYKDYLSIRYSGTDRLYVPVENMDVVQKYIGTNDQGPKLSKLGGQEWTNAKRKVKQSIRDMADELIKLYAQRMNTRGFVFAPDTPWQRQFEMDFPYEETPDQLQCLKEIKQDMESEKAMDRLLCGDVGYGKTEVAIRAAFKAVMSGKQVAFLCPTTILAQQHYNTVVERMYDYGVVCNVLSRFKTPKQQKEIMERLKEGKIDLIVGTHRLLSKDVEFKDLGLLIVDEEQRFGVAHKEKIKQLKNNVDVLTLSATPIPRTLHMALSGIRDLSVIETAPQERFPVQTYVMEYSETIVKDAVMREIARGGQVYFLYNNVSGMDVFASYLRRIIPEARILTAHGQMSESVLEKTISAFYNGEADVLLCSTIIENGVDIPAANTMIVYDADNFGLSQLYQLKGRVGRSNRLAYAYMMFRPNTVLTEVAEKRLSAIRDFTDLGAGFKIAMRDLEIRGAGNLLGGEQHGHMASVGYDMYCKLLQESVAEIQGSGIEQRVETKIEIKYDAYIPETYIANEVQKLQIYKRIAEIQSRTDVEDVTDELIDRYGDLPKTVMNLLEVALIKGLSARAGITKVVDRGTYLEAIFGGVPRFDVLAEVVSANKMCHINANAAVSVILKKKGNTGLKELTALIEDYVAKAK